MFQERPRMIFDWFDARAASEFGITLAEFIAQRIPLSSDKPKSGKKQQEIFQKAASQITQFKSRKKLNVYTKAKLANSFKWKLLDLGYDKELVDEMTKELLVAL
jgi:hypothetical protein